jgi:hypothetical protein
MRNIHVVQVFHSFEELLHHEVGFLFSQVASFDDKVEELAARAISYQSEMAYSNTRKHMSSSFFFISHTSTKFIML